METTSLLHDPAFWLLVLFAIPLILRVPIALALGFSALVVVWQWDLGFSMLSYNFFAGIAKFPLLAIPFFILAGYIMERSGIAARIVALMEALVVSMTGGRAVILGPVGKNFAAGMSGGHILGRCQRFGPCHRGGPGPYPYPRHGQSRV